MIERDGQTYLETNEAQAFVGYRSYTWLADRVRSGLLTRYRVGKKPYYKQSELEPLVGVTVARAEQHAHTPEELAHLHKLKEVARAADISYSYLWKLIHAGEIAVVNLGGRGRATDLRISDEEFKRFVESRTQRRRKRSA